MKRTKIGTSNKEAMKSLVATNVIGPTTGAATLMKRKDAPQAAPIAKIKNQSSKDDLLFIIIEFVVSYLGLPPTIVTLSTLLSSGQ